MKNLTTVSQKRIRDGTAWGVMWHSQNKLDGVSKFLIYNSPARIPHIFKTRRLANVFIEAVYGYIRTRPDLRAEPHGWRMPKAVKVTITPNGPDKQRA
jgi:hypothetical protein